METRSKLRGMFQYSIPMKALFRRPLFLIASFTVLVANHAFAAEDEKVVATQTEDGMILTLPGNLEVTNPPTEVAAQPPDRKAFGRLFGEFFDFAGFTFDGDGLARLRTKIAGETSNGLYARWKLRESKFRGAISVEPMQGNHEQVIIVRARILYLEQAQKTLRIDTIMIHYSGKGVFKGVGTALGTKQLIDPPKSAPEAASPGPAHSR
jgi:hypothetical protein